MEPDCALPACIVMAVIEYDSQCSQILELIPKYNCLQPPVSKEFKQYYSREFYRAIVGSTIELIAVLDEEGTYTFVGDSVVASLGYTPEELLGVSALSFIHPEDLPSVKNALEELLKFNTASFPLFRFKAKQGDWRWIECTGRNMLHNDHVRGIMVTSRDVTEAIQLAYDKDYHQAYYKSLFFEHPDTVFTLDINGAFQQVNKHIQTLTAYSKSDILGLPYTALLHPDHVKIATDAISKVWTGEAHTVEVRIVTKLGDIKNISVSVMPVYFRGEVQGVQGIAKDITEAVQAQKLIRQQAQQLNSILDSITEPFYALDHEWRFSFASTSFASFIKMDRSQITGRVIWELWPELKSSKFYGVCQQVAEQQTAAYLEEAFTTPYPGYLHISIYPTPDGVAVHFIDVTEQKNIQREIEKLSLVASKTVNGVIIMDAERKIEWVNDGFCRITGYDREEVLGQIPSDLLQGPGTDPKVAQRIVSKYNSRKPFSEEVLNYRKSGEILWFYIDVTPIFDQEGNLKNFIAIQTDVTEKKEAEGKLLKLADDLYKHNLDLQQFTYIISHNLRAPVANALGLIQLVNKLPKESANFDVAKNKLQASIQQLDTVVKDINKILSLRESGRVTQRETVCLARVCQEVLGQFEDEFLKANVAVHVAIAPDHCLLSIKAYLHSILYNLLSNSLKYKAEDRQLEIWVQTERDKRGYVLTVRDSGSGMDMQLVQKQLFQLYKRFHPNTFGKGIGLFMVKTQVQALGGKIDVESTLNQGTTFKIYLGAKHV